MLIRTATLPDVDGWVALRVRLWPDASVDHHRDEAVAMLARPPGAVAAFVALRDDGGVRGFAEAALRHDYVNGCDTSPVAFLEGIYVRPEDRGAGVGGHLSMAVQNWARELGCAELASDALLANVGSHAFHRAIGFEETERVVYFRRKLQGQIRPR